MNNKTIKVTKPYLPDYDDYIQEIKSIWDNNWLTNMGPKHDQLENELKEFMDVENVSLFNNGHIALEYVIAAFNLTGEVITTPFTFASTTHAIVRNNLTPVFCDIKPNDYTIDASKIEALITDKTSAIVPVHIYGNICDVESIQRIADKYNLKVIYDAAHAFGVKYKDVGIGNFGDASMFSFHATKVFHTIEGGAITFKDKENSKAINSIKNFGIVSEDTIEFIGGNGKMNEFQAAMGICNLRTVDVEIKKRENAYQTYIELLNNIPGIKLMVIQNDVVSNYSYFPILFENYKYSRDEVYEILKSQGIFSRKYFYPLTNEFECYKNMFYKETTPIAKKISENILTLPFYPDITKDEIMRICEIIKEGI